VLEDDSVSLSTMKASKFYSSFAQRIDYWEETLNTVSEVRDKILME
jgi:dynein heavy chain, axonemal